jgi:hypothetical protein
LRKPKNDTERRRDEDEDEDEDERRGRKGRRRLRRMMRRIIRDCKHKKHDGLRKINEGGGYMRVPNREDISREFERGDQDWRRTRVLLFIHIPLQIKHGLIQRIRARRQTDRRIQ